jgi:serine/threonine protein phosphatase PrpC
MSSGVFDGHGGDAVAIWLNDNLQEYIRPALEQSDNIEDALTAAFHAADSEVLEYLETASAGGDLKTGAGATASVVIAKPNQIITASIGDSLAVLFRNGKDIVLTTPHRVYGKCGSHVMPIDSYLALMFYVRLIVYAVYCTMRSLHAAAA